MTPPNDPFISPKFDDSVDTIDPELAALLKDPTLWEEPTADLGERVRAAVADERNQLRPKISARTVAPVIQLQRRFPTKWLAAAAALLIAVGGFGLARRSANVEPEFVSIALAPTDLFPNATGSVQITETESGLQIKLDATGLPRREGRFFYEAWMKGEGGLVPIGTFHIGENVTLWAGVSLEDFPAITITEEEVGDQNSSGRKVLTGTSNK